MQERSTPHPPSVKQSKIRAAEEAAAEYLYYQAAGEKTQMIFRRVFFNDLVFCEV